MDELRKQHDSDNIAIKSQALSANNLYLAERLDSSDRKASVLIPAAGIMISLMHSDLYLTAAQKPNALQFQFLIAALFFVAIVAAITVQFPRRLRGSDLLSQQFGKTSVKTLTDKIMQMDDRQVIEDCLSSQAILIRLFEFKNNLIKISSVSFGLGCLINFIYYMQLTTPAAALNLFSRIFELKGA
jgi:hypothetical protein